MTEYRVTHTRDDHNDEWSNEYTTTCIKDEFGHYVHAVIVGSPDGTAYVEWRVIPFTNVIKVEKL